MTRLVTAVDAWQRRHALGGVPIAVAKKFGEDRASSLGALIAYYGFFSLFPLLLAFVSVLGFVLEDNPSLQADIVDSTLARIPVIGAQLDDQIQPLTGSGVALAVGLAGVVDRHHGGMLEPGGQARLGQEAAAEFLVAGKLGGDHLERHRPIQRQLRRSVDDAHTAAAELLGSAVVRERPTDQRIPGALPVIAAVSGELACGQIDRRSGEKAVCPVVCGEQRQDFVLQLFVAVAGAP